MPGALTGTFTKDLYFEALPYMVLSDVPITGGHRQTCRWAYYPDTIDFRLSLFFIGGTWP